MNGKLLAYSAAVLIGVAGTIAWYEFKESSASEQAPATMLDSFSTGDKFADDTPDASLAIEAPGIEGSVDAFEMGDLLVLRIRLESDDTTEIHGQMNNPGLEFKGVSNQSANAVDGFLFATGNFSIAESSSKNFLVVLQESPEAETAPDGDIQFVVTKNREILFRGTLNR